MSRIEAARATIFVSRRTPTPLWSWRCDCGACAPAGTRESAKRAVEHHLKHDCVLVDATRAKLAAPSSPDPSQCGGAST